MDDGSTSGQRGPPHARPHLSAHDARRAFGAVHLWCGRAAQPFGPALAFVLCAGLAGSPCHCRRDQPASGETTHCSPVCRAGPTVASDCPPDLALFREVCDGGRKLPATRQFSGEPQTRDCQPDLTDQHRSLSAFHRRRARYGLDRPAGRLAADERHAANDPAHATLSWASVQLAQYTRSACA